MGSTILTDRLASTPFRGIYALLQLKVVWHQIDKSKPIGATPRAAPAKTSQGKTTSSRNAARHGLSRQNAEGSVGAARLQACCSDEFTELWRNELDMAHIRAARQELRAEIARRKHVDANSSFGTAN